MIVSSHLIVLVAEKTNTVFPFWVVPTGSVWQGVLQVKFYFSLFFSQLNSILFTPFRSFKSVVSKYPSSTGASPLGI